MFKKIPILLILILSGFHTQVNGVPCLVAGYRDACRTKNDFKKVSDVQAYVKEQPTLTQLRLVHHKGYPKSFSLTFLNEHPHITHLDLGGMAEKPSIFHLSELTHVTSLSIHLDRGFGECCKPNWDQTCHMPQLQELYTSMEHFDFLGEMPRLRVLSLQPCWYSNGVKFDLSGIERYPLTALNIKLDAIEDPNVLGLLVDLEELTIEGHHLKAEDFEFIRKLRKLKKLKIYNTGEMDFDVLDSLPDLEDIQFDFHAEKNLEILGILPKLRRLHLGDYKLSHLSFLKGCKTIEDFSCGFCAVTSIEALRELPLKRLILTGAKIKDLRPIKNIPTLEILDISCNSPHYWESLTGHPSLRRIRGCKNDFVLPTHVMGWHEMENLTLDPQTRSLDSQAQQYLVDREKALPQLTESNVFDILATMPKLELIKTETQDYPQNVLSEFKTKRPDVKIGDYVDWEKTGGK